MKRRVVVAMSGGVDSSVVAAILHERGYEVIGITLQLYNYNEVYPRKNFKTCCASKDITDAAQVCEKLGIKHYVLNYESVFKKEVIESFADSYLNGFTPVPCVRCNQTVKFRDLYDIAKKLGAEFLATGHYVRKIIGSRGPELHKGKDVTKDQSYFLFQITPEQLDFLEFPLGDMYKNETRELAQKYGFSLAQKPDSQDICFVPNGNYADVIRSLRIDNAFKKGSIIDIETGKILGEHSGIANYTIGQRKRLGVNSQVPLFVIKINSKENAVFVGTEKYLFRMACEMEEFSMLVKSENDIDFTTLEARVRSSSEPIPCELDIKNRICIMKQPTKMLAPGQAAVFYNNTKIIGGSFIKKILDS